MTPQVGEMWTFGPYRGASGVGHNDAAWVMGRILPTDHLRTGTVRVEILDAAPPTRTKWWRVGNTVNLSLARSHEPVARVEWVYSDGLS